VAGPGVNGQWPKPAEGLHPLGRREYAFWTLQQLAPDSSVSNLPVALRTRGVLRWWPVQAAVNQLLVRHPALRTRFPEVAGAPARQLTPATDVQFTVEMCPATHGDLARQIHQAAMRPFDLARELPLRVILYQLPQGGSALLLVVHHIVADAASMTMLVRELGMIYDGVAAGSGIPEQLRGEVPVSPEEAVPPGDLSYWTAQLRGADAGQAALPWARPSPVQPTFAGHSIVTSMAPQTGHAVEALRQHLRSTENLILLSGFYLTLLRHGAGRELTVGVPVTTRGGTSDGMGFQVSTLPLRAQLDPAASFTELVRRVRQVFAAGIEHAGASAETLLAELGHQSADWRVPFFRHQFNYLPWDDSVEIAGERPEFIQLLRTDSRVDIQLNVIGGRQSPVLVTNFSTEVHEEHQIRALLERMEALLQAAAADPSCPVCELDMLTRGERLLLDRVNDTGRQAKLLPNVFSQIMAVAETAPEATAIIAGGVPHRYSAVRARAGQFRAALRAAGVSRGDVVALALGRGPEMAAAILGTWAAGAAYLPLEPASPEARRAFQLADADVRAVIAEHAEAALAERRVIAAAEVVDLTASAGGSAEAADAVEEVPGLDSAAYVIYTSGSTGQPKGVVVTHRNLANVVSDFAARLGVCARDAMLWSTNTGFDISALELLLPLSRGGKVVACGEDWQDRPRELLDLVVKHDVSLIQATPTAWRILVAEADGELRGRTVLCGGERISAALARDLLAAGVRLFNVYGPTETTIWSTVAELTSAPAEPVPIGRPIADTVAFVTDAVGGELPPGLPGELCLGGAGVSAGYLRRPELTAERFRESKRWGRYYRTGDVVRWRADGSLELIGRNDRQVKLRGQRIDLAEIEAVLCEHASVAVAAAVIAGDPQGQGELRVFVVPAPGTDEGRLPGELWGYLRTRMPHYALPSGIAARQSFPVTANGKLDYEALRSADIRDAAGAPPPGEPGPDPGLTTRLLALWREALGRPQLDEHDNFFLNGGHSLLVAQISGRVAELAGRQVHLRMLFAHPTAYDLSAHLTAAST
jgi:amino acid adenylation domain-containing protein